MLLHELLEDIRRNTMELLHAEIAQEGADGVDWWSLFLLEQPQPQVSLLQSFKDFTSQ